MAKDKKNEAAEKEEAKSANKDAEKAKDGEAAEGEAEGEGGKKPGKKKKLIIIVAALLIVVAIAVPLVLFLTGKIGKKHEAGDDKEAAAESSESGGVQNSVFYDMEEFVVNLNVGDKRPSFLKMTVSLEIANELQIPTIEKNMPRIRDNFQVYLRELRQEDLQGSAGLYRLREELLLRVNKVAYPAKIIDILFKEILVQ